MQRSSHWLGRLNGPVPPDVVYPPVTARALDLHLHVYGISAVHSSSTAWYGLEKEK